MYYDSIELTQEEIELALIEGKKKKFFNLRNADHWKDLDKGVTKTEEYFKPSQSCTLQKGCNDPLASPTPGHGFRS